jgi:hypothetical protein
MLDKEAVFLNADSTETIVFEAVPDQSFAHATVHPTTLDEYCSATQLKHILHFTTGKGIQLGMSMPQVLSVLGDPTKDAIYARGEELTYECGPECRFVSGDYLFFHGVLVEFSIGYYEP